MQTDNGLLRSEKQTQLSLRHLVQLNVKRSMVSCKYACEITMVNLFIILTFLVLILWCQFDFFQYICLHLVYKNISDIIYHTSFGMTCKFLSWDDFFFILFEMNIQLLKKLNGMAAYRWNRFSQDQNMSWKK